MSESTSEDFSDSDSDVSQEEAAKVPEKGKRKVDSNVEEDSDSDSGDDEPEAAPQPVKKRKRLQDYLNERVNISVESGKLFFNLNKLFNFRQQDRLWRKQKREHVKKKSMPVVLDFQ